MNSSIDPTETFNRSERLFVESRSNGFGEEVKRRILLGTYALSASGMENYFLKAQKIRKTICEEFKTVFKSNNEEETTNSIPEKVDILLTPPTLSIAPELNLGESDVIEEGLEIRKSWGQDQLLVPASLAGLPSLVVPLEKIEVEEDKGKKWPIGVQLIGPWGSEISLFRVGKVIEQERGKEDDSD